MQGSLSWGGVVAALATALAVSAQEAAQAAVIGTEDGEVILFQGTAQTITQTFTNAYSGRSITLSGAFVINNETYDGLGGFDTMTMGLTNDVLVLDTGGTAPTIANIERIIGGRGADFINLSSLNFVLGPMELQGSGDDDIIWGNVGDDLFRLNTGNNAADGGPGFDTIELMDDALEVVITRLGTSSFSILSLPRGTTDRIDDIENIRFADGSELLAASIPALTQVSEPAGLTSLAFGLLGLAGILTPQSIRRGRGQGGARTVPRAC